MRRGIYASWCCNVVLQSPFKLSLQSAVIHKTRRGQMTPCNHGCRICLSLRMTTAFATKSSTMLRYARCTSELTQSTFMTSPFLSCCCLRACSPSQPPTTLRTSCRQLSAPQSSLELRESGFSYEPSCTTCEIPDSCLAILAQTSVSGLASASEIEADAVALVFPRAWFALQTNTLCLPRVPRVTKNSYTHTHS